MAKWVNHYAPTGDPDFILVGNEWHTRKEAQDEWEKQKILNYSSALPPLRRVALIRKKETS